MKTTISLAISLSPNASDRLALRRFSMYTEEGNMEVETAIRIALAAGLRVAVTKSGVHLGNVPEAAYSAVYKAVGPRHPEVGDTDVRDSILYFMEALLEGRMEEKLDVDALDVI